MHIKWSDPSNRCKHGNYEDNCEMCKQDQKIEKLEEVFRCAKLFVKCKFPEDYTAYKWFSEIDKFGVRRKFLENELIKAINKIEPREAAIPIKHNYKAEMQAMLDEAADQKPAYKKNVLN